MTRMRKRDLLLAVAGSGGMAGGRPVSLPVLPTPEPCWQCSSGTQGGLCRRTRQPAWVECSAGGATTAP